MTQTLNDEPIPVAVPLRTLTLHQPRRHAFGCGSLRDCIAYLADLRPGHLRIVTSASLRGTAERIVGELANAGVASSIDSAITSEPAIEVCRTAVDRAREAGTTCVLGLGGGSALDIAKLVAAFVRNDQRIEETFGIGLLRERACHLVCLPTTSGTGSEVSPNAILLDEAAHLKKGVISPHLVPDATFVDPELTLSLPAGLTAATGLDALAHCVEAYTNNFAHPIVDLYALEGIRLCRRFLVRAVQVPGDLEAREGMALASLYGGLCLGPVNTAAAHALAYPLGGEYHIAHGVSVALLLPHVFRFNAVANSERHAVVAEALGCPSQPDRLATANAGATMLVSMLHACGLDPNLANHGVPASAVPSMATAAMTVTRLLRNNPRPLEYPDCVSIYSACFAPNAVG